jgi:integrase/recombinase XerD
MKRGKNTKKLPVILEDSELKAILNAATKSKRGYTGLRNKAMVILMANLGLRVSEITNLKEKNIDLETRKLRVIEGKYLRDRDLKIPARTAEVLKDYNVTRKPGEYFFNTKEGDKLQKRYIQATVKKLAARAKINKRISPHTLRHTFATNYYRQFKDIETLRIILGHGDISTTQIYVTLANLEVEASLDNFREVA